METSDLQTLESDVEKPYQDPEILEELYTERGLKLEDIGDRYGCSKGTVGRYVREHGITRKHEDPDVLRELYVEKRLPLDEIADRLHCSVWSVRKHLEKNGIDRDRRYRDADWLREKYWVEGLSTTEIAALCNATHPAITEWMKRHEIERRGLSESQTDGDIEKLHDYDWLHEEYISKERTTVDIGQELGVTTWVVGEWVKRHGMETRPSPADVSGPENPNYKGGWQKYYGPSWYPARRKALERDDHECQVCGMGREEHVEAHNEGPHVHHIIPFHKFGVERHEEANALSNLVVLCRKHHVKWEGIPLKPQVMA